jgi:hypothetical protein
LKSSNNTPNISDCFAGHKLAKIQVKKMGQAGQTLTPFLKMPIQRKKCAGEGTENGENAGRTYSPARSRRVGKYSYTRI